MSKVHKVLANTYQYDPLNRLCAANSLQRFYNNTRIATEIEGERKTRFFETDSQPLALQQHGTAPGTTLFATDQQTSVLNGISAPGEQQAQAYSPFGFHPLDALLNVVGFNGERPDPVTGHYLLGQGYRAFNPVLMRFNNPDSWSPFGEGGINAYAYCDNNPSNLNDPSGHFPNLIKAFKNMFMGRVPKRLHPTVSKARTPTPPQIKIYERQMTRTTPPSMSDEPVKPLSRRRTKLLRTEYKNNQAILKKSNEVIESDSLAFGQVTHNRFKDPELHDMVMDQLIFRDNLLDRQHVISTRLNEVPDYNILTGLPRYSDALQRELNIQKVNALVRQTSTAILF